MKDIIIFGKGLFVEIIYQYFNEYPKEFKIACFTLDDDFIEEPTYLGLPLIKFSEIDKLYPPSKYDMFVGLSYTDMNRLRETKYHEAKNKGYKLISYISPECTWKTEYPIGDNSFIFEDNTIQPFTKIGSNVILWSGNHIGHHTTIEDHNFISSHVVISGQCNIKSNCFIGVNSTIGHGVTINRETLVGAGSTITKNTEEKSVYVPSKSIKLDKTSDQFKL